MSYRQLGWLGLPLISYFVSTEDDFAFSVVSVFAAPVDGPFSDDYDFIGVVDDAFDDSHWSTVPEDSDLFVLGEGFQDFGKFEDVHILCSQRWLMHSKP
jgi:hypothetical protein